MGTTRCWAAPRLLAHPGRGLQFDAVPLAIVEAQGVAVEAFSPGDCQSRGRIEAAAQQTNSGFHVGTSNYTGRALDVSAEHSCFLHSLHKEQSACVTLLNW